MFKLLNKHLNNREGFSLIELIVVIVILAVLAAVLIPNISGWAKRARENADIATAATIATAAGIVITDGVESPAGTWTAKAEDGTDIKLVSTEEVKDSLKPLLPGELQNPQSNPTGEWVVTYDPATGIVVTDKTYTYYPTKDGKIWETE